MQDARFAPAVGLPEQRPSNLICRRTGMKSPRSPKSRSVSSLAHPIPPSILDLVAASAWAGPIVIGKPTLISWRTTLSLVMADVPIVPVASQLWATLQAMADQIVNASNDEVAVYQAADYHVSYFRWLDWWQSQFSHWDDPIRALVAQHCSTGDAVDTAKHFPMFNGLAFCDFVLAAVEAYDERSTRHARMSGQPMPEPSLPLSVFSSQHKPLMERVCLQLYFDFQQKVAFPTGPAPLGYDLTPLLAEIYAYDNEDSDEARPITCEAEQ